jgi:class 3 adenylate cyclase
VDTPEVRYAHRDGRAIAYQTWGSGPIVDLFVSEWPANVDSVWEHPLHLRIWRYHGSFARLIRVDRSGIGSSDPPAGEIGDLDEWSADLLAVLDAEGAATVVVSGEGWGGHAAITLAAKHPERIDRLVLVNTFVTLTADGDGPPMSPVQLDATIDFVRSSWGTGRVIDASAGFGHDYLDFCGRYERIAASPGAAAAMARAAYASDVGHLLPQIACPTLVLFSGAYSYISQAQCRDLAERIEGAEFIAADSVAWYAFGPDVGARYVEFITGSAGDAWVERELAVVVFSDIVDSTVQLASRGDREWTGLLETTNDSVARNVGRFGGRVVKQTGDGHLMTFTSPGAAISAVYEMRRSAHALGLSMRFGVHMGEIERREDGDIAGLTVHAAARIAQVAGRDEIVVSRLISDLLAGTGPEFVDLGSHELKGLPSALQLFSIRSTMTA